MKCPLCEGEFEAVELRTRGANLLEAQRCTNCGGFWLPRHLDEALDPNSLTQLESAQPNYSLKTIDLVCPRDRTLMTASEQGHHPTGAKSWSCSECGGMFFPRGQLSHITNHQAVPENDHPMGLLPRAQGAIGVSLIMVLVVAVLASLNNFALTFSASDGSPLPTSAPNLFTLLLLAMAYVAGTILAVLGRKLPIIITGWSVIAVCLFSFAVVIFGP